MKKSPQRLFENSYGYFSEDGKEYIIKNPRTPRPWTNVISNGDYGLIISQTGGGYSWRTNAQLNRLTRWGQDVIKDEWGKYLFVRDEISGEYWSAAWKPVMRTPEYYEVRHGFGYTVVTSLNNGIEIEWTLFVPMNEPLEVWKVVVRNRSRKKRRLKLFSYFEWGLGAAPDWHREFHKCFTKTEYVSLDQVIFATKRLWEIPSEDGHWNKDWGYVAFHSVNSRGVSFDCSKESFLGMYGSLTAPASVKSGKAAKNSGNWFDAIGSLMVPLSLAPGKEQVTIFTLGAADRREEALGYVRKYKDRKHTEDAFVAVQQRWKEILSKSEVSTPDKGMNILLNGWLKYQAISGRLWGRTSYYQAGGAFGFRDQLQDSMIFLTIEPSQTVHQILLHSRHQFKDGTVYHWWHPLSEVGHPTQMTDDLLWLPFVVCGYLEETNDYGILDLQEPFIDDVQLTSIEEHCIRTIDRVLQRFSPRGLPLIGAGDWNDGISAAGLQMKGESIWLGEFLYKILIDFSKVLRHRSKYTLADKYSDCAKQLRKNLNDYGWDGEWYYYGTKDSGEKFGSKENAEGMIHLNPQTWAVIAEVADCQRAEAVMDVVKERLEYKAGTLLLHPAYSMPDEKIGYLTRYAPGTRENGAVYTHAATWSVIAMAKMRRADDAYRIFSKLSPINRAKNPDEYCAEPYVTPGNIDGPDSKFYGRGGWTWYSGSAAWLWRAVFEWILGVRASENGLVIDPCIPARWKEYKVQRIFRGALFFIVIKNPLHKNNGVTRVTLNGNILENALQRGYAVLPEMPLGSTNNVEILLG